MKLWGRLAAGWALLFAAVHLYWAMGGTAGLASSAGRELATRRPGWFVAAGLWGVAVLLLSAAALAIVLTEGRYRRLLALAGGAVGLLLVARGLAVELFLLAGTYDANAAISAGQRHWSLLVWNPWFAGGGVAFVLAARSAFHRGEQFSRRRQRVRVRARLAQVDLLATEGTARCRPGPADVAQARRAAAAGTQLSDIVIRDRGD